jgi:hypothetical protein
VTQCRSHLADTSAASAAAAAGAAAAAAAASLQATSRNYKAYAQRLSSWGFAVLQYDFMALSPWIDQLCHSDAAEVRVSTTCLFLFIAVWWWCVGLCGVKSGQLCHSDAAEASLSKYWLRWSFGHASV